MEITIDGIISLIKINKAHFQREHIGQALPITFYQMALDDLMDDLKAYAEEDEEDHLTASQKYMIEADGCISGVCED